jgi:hypothetical protein
MIKKKIFKQTLYFINIKERRVNVKHTENSELEGTYLMYKGKGGLLETSPSTGHQSIQWFSIFTLVHGNVVAK